MEGSLRDSLGYPVPYAQVQGRRDAGLPWAIMGFTDSLGLFRLAPGETHSLALRFTALGYLQQDTLLSRGKGGQWPRLSLVMPEAAVALQEVVLRGDQALRIRRDTIEFRVDTYLKGAEEVAEDVLRQLPGVSVGEDGEIRVRGKPVRSVLVEGDDLMDRGYRVLTQNLDASAIARVQVLEGYQENQVLGRMKPSGEVALNLVLRPEIKGKWAGRLDLGSGGIRRNQSRVNLINLRKGTKTYILGNANTTGADPVGDIYSLLHPDPLAGEYPPGSGENTGSAGMPQLIPLPLDRSLYLPNNARMGAFSSAAHPAEGVKITTQVLAASERVRMRWRHKETLVAPDTVFRFTEARDQHLRQRVFQGKVLLDAGADTLWRVSLKNHWSLSRAEGSEQLLVNTNPQVQQTQGVLNRWDTALEFSRRWDTRTLVRVGGRWLQEGKERLLEYDGFALAPVFGGEGQGWETREEGQLGLGYLGFRAGVLRRYGSRHLEFQAQLEKVRWRGQRELRFGNPSGFLGPGLAVVSEHRRRIGFLLEWGREGEHLRWLLGLRLQYTGSTFPGQAARPSPGWVFLPSARLRWRPRPLHTFRASYRYTARESHFENQWQAPGLRDYRTVHYGMGHWTRFLGHQASLGYTYGNWGHQTTFQALGMWKLEPLFEGRSLVQSATYSGTRLLPLSGRQWFQVTLDLDHFLPSLGANLKWKVQFNRNRNPMHINGVPTLRVNQSLSWGPEFRMALGNRSEAHSGVAFSRTWLQTQGKTRADALKGFLDLDSHWGQGWSGHLTTEFIANPDSGSEPLWLSHLRVVFKPEKGRFSYRLGVENLWNAGFYGVRSLQQAGYQDSGYPLLGRQVLIQVSMRL
ncbi:TonB-dependent receptor [Robiginitalea sediminis]|uniref:TonB-dependent receptor n=1 Tax=Robiginitalea sediminis TaxID=1982593 RepID=UPI000B4B0824|nr:TonB-dependent receptor [Robiginitalea sediminis]